MMESVLAGLLDLLCKPLCLAVSVLCVLERARVLVCAGLVISSLCNCVSVRGRICEVVRRSTFAFSRSKEERLMLSLCYR